MQISSWSGSLAGPKVWLYFIQSKSVELGSKGYLLGGEKRRVGWLQAARRRCINYTGELRPV